MGKIPVFQRQKFASTYVGGPQVDRTGEIITAGIGKVVETGVGIAAKQLQAKEEARIDQQANNALIKYSLDYQRNMKDLEDQYADDPSAFPEAVQNMGLELQNSYMENIADERIRTRFGTAASSVIKQSSIASVGWAFAKEEENALAASRDTMRLMGIKTGDTFTPEALNQNINTTLTEIAAIPNLSKGEKEKFLEDNMETVLGSHFYNRVNFDPEQLITDLNAGVYKDTPYYTDAMKVKFVKAARTKMRQDKTVMKESQTEVYAQLIEEDTAGTLTFDKIDAAHMVEDESMRITSKWAAQLKKNLVRKIESDANRIVRNEEDAEKYVNLIYDVFDNKIDRAKALEQIVDIFADGITTREESAFLTQARGVLKDTRSQKMSAGVRKGLDAISTAVDKFYAGRARLTPKAQAFRDLVTGIQEGQTPEEATKAVTKQATLGKLSTMNIDLGTIPQEGMSLTDKNGKEIWVYPDGSYKEM